MLCERCGKNQATAYFKEVINGVAREQHICSECAAELGYENLFESFDPFNMMKVNFGNFLGGMFSQTLPEHSGSEHRCSVCGSSFEDIAHDAMAGCSNCYREFYNELLPSIRRIHGKTKHIGKIPGAAGKEIKEKKELESLKTELDEAVKAQEYEKAAKLRDKIRDIENGGKH